MTFVRNGKTFNPPDSVNPCQYVALTPVQSVSEISANSVRDYPQTRIPLQGGRGFTRRKYNCFL